MGLCAFRSVLSVVLLCCFCLSFIQVMLALSAHLGSLEAEKQKLRAQVNISQTRQEIKTTFILLHHLPSLLPSLFLLILFTGTSSVPGEPVVERRVGRFTAAPPRQGAGGGNTRGAEQTPAVHVLHKEIWCGGATNGEELTSNYNSHDSTSLFKRGKSSKRSYLFKKNMITH